MPPSSARPLTTSAFDLPEWVRLTVAVLDLDAIAEAVVDTDLRYAFPAQAGNDDFRLRLLLAVRENMSAMQDVLLGGERLDQIEVVRPIAFARVQARLGITAGMLQHAYRVGYIAALEFVTDQLERRSGEMTLTAREGIAGVRAFAVALRAFQDQVLANVTAAHREESDAMRASREDVRRRLLRDLLTETPHPPTDVSVSSDLLEYDLTAWHLAVMVDEEPSAIEAVGQALAASAGATAWIALELGPRTTSVWVGRSAPFQTADRAAVLDALRVLGLRASVGDPASGPEGLRETYRDVEAIERVRAASGTAGPPLLTFADVQLETLLLSEPDDLRRFVDDELGPLAEQSEEMSRLRETIVAWYETGSNVSAATALGLHEHTVRNRLRRAESLLGHALSTRRLELRTALRMLPVAPSELVTSSGEPR